MNNHFDEATYKLGAADAMMTAVESALVDLELLPEDRKRMDKAAYLFYAAWDAIKDADKELAEYAAECRIVNVIESARATREN